MIPPCCSTGAKPRHVLAALLLPMLSLTGQTIPNPSFEADTFATFPGYISGVGNGPITGWTGTPTDRVGINPSDGSPFANNGIIPDGTNVAFIQAGASGPASLETTISGLTVGTTYTVTFRTTARSEGVINAPWLVVSTTGEGEPVGMEVQRVEGTGLYTMDYRQVGVEFTATATEHQLTLTNTRTTGDHTVVVDDFKIAESIGDWTVSPWTGDEDSGIQSDFHYTHAYSLGRVPTAGVVLPHLLINDVPFIHGEAGVAGRFALGGLGSLFHDRGNTLTGASVDLAKDFRYGGSPSIRLENLKPNTEYVFSLYGIGFDEPTGDPHRSATFSSDAIGSGVRTIDLNEFGMGNGLVVNHRYTTDEFGSPVTINYPPTGAGSFHTSGFTNRELAPRTQTVTWSTHPWTSDEDSGIQTNYRYTHTLNLGSAESVPVNGVVFTGVPGSNPVATNYSLTAAGVYNNDVNNAITGSSELLSRNFLYGSHPEIHTISGLNPGTDYVFSLYSTGWEAPGGRINAFIGAMGEEAVLIDQDEFDNNNGIRIDYRYTADASGTLIITSSSMDLASSIHVVAISNREAAPVVGAPSITLQPSGTSLGVYSNHILSVGAIGEGTLTYQWKLNGVDIAGATGPTLDFTDIAYSQSGAYSVTISNSVGSVTSEVAAIEVFDNIPGLFNTGVADNGQPLINGEVDPHYTLVINANDPLSSDAFVHQANPGAWLPNSATSKWIAPLPDTAAAVATGESDGIYVYQTQVDLTGVDLETVEIKGNWGTDNSGLTMRINGVDIADISNSEGNTFGLLKPFSITLENAPNLEAGINTLDFVVNNAAPAGYTALRVEGLQAIGRYLPNIAPQIVVQPEGSDGIHNQTVRLSVGTRGTAPLSYVWSRNGTVIAGENQPTLDVEIASLDSGGDYQVVVSNLSGTATSEVATITVLNNIPFAGDDALAADVNTPLPIDFLADLVINDSDADNDELFLASFSATSAEGGTIVENEGLLIYTPPTGFVGVDTFTYVINDGPFGGVSESATVSITVGEAVPGAEPGPLTLTLSGGTVNGSFTGTPGASFTLQRSTTLEANSWVDVQTVVAPESGTVAVADPAPPAGKAFYRIAYAP